jgi:MraZ protein
MWDKAAYNKMIDSEPDNFALLAEEVMGDKRKEVGV